MLSIMEHCCQCAMAFIAKAVPLIFATSYIVCRALILPFAILNKRKNVLGKNERIGLRKT